MPKIFTKAGADVLGMLDKQMLDFHPQLHAMDVKVGVIMVQPAVDKNCQPTGPAVSCHGVCVAAKIKLLSASDRVYLRYDAMMFIDELRWNNMDEKECNALLDHELTHLRLILDKNGQPKTNDDNRRCV